MAKKLKTFKPKARVPKGFRDETAGDVVKQQEMLAKIRGVFNLFGFEALDTSTIGYADARPFFRLHICMCHRDRVRNQRFE